MTLIYSRTTRKPIYFIPKKEVLINSTQQTLELLEERKVLDHVRRVARRYQERLRSFSDHPLVGEARGAGLMGAVEVMAHKRTKRAFKLEQGAGLHRASPGSTGLSSALLRIPWLSVRLSSSPSLRLTRCSIGSQRL